MIPDHLNMLDAWVATVKTLGNPPEGLDVRILTIAEHAIRVHAFTLMPEGPENALALFVMTESFRKLRGESISDDELKQIGHALTLSRIATERARGIAA